MTAGEDQDDSSPNFDRGNAGAWLVVAVDLPGLEAGTSRSAAVKLEMLQGNTLCSADFSMTLCNQLSI